ncbi:MAG: hypothetical protein Kow0069_11450 [Promethearchaeota archaeon]
MSYVPKYILKRMIPADAMRAVEDGVEITVVNVLGPLAIDEIPDDYMSYLDKLQVKVDGTPLTEEQKAGIKIKHEGEVFDRDNLKEAVGRTVPVGGKLVLFAPVTGLAVGEEHEVEIRVELDSPFEVKFARVLQA